jgi:hypothetical protein
MLAGYWESAYIVTLADFGLQRSSTISSSINHRVLNFCLKATRLAKHINDYKDNTIALTLGSNAQKYAVVRTSLRIP